VASACADLSHWFAASVLEMEGSTSLGGAREGGAALGDDGFTLEEEEEAAAAVAVAAEEDGLGAYEAGSGMLLEDCNTGTLNHTDGLNSFKADIHVHVQLTLTKHIIIFISHIN
jgi:hypothetical protein